MNDHIDLYEKQKVKDKISFNLGLPNNPCSLLERSLAKPQDNNVHSSLGRENVVFQTNYFCMIFSWDFSVQHKEKNLIGKYYYLGTLIEWEF